MRVYLDESGQEWANLMEPSSGPVATYGSTCLSDDDAADLLDEFRPTGLSKKHKSKAWLRPNTVEATIGVLHRAPPDALVVGVAYRPWFAVAKLVSLAVDEGHYEAKQFSLETLMAPDGRPLGAVLAERFWDQLRIPGTFDLTPEGSAGLVDFQQFVLRGDPAAGDRLIRWTADCMAAATDDLASVVVRNRCRRQIADCLRTGRLDRRRVGRLRAGGAGSCFGVAVARARLSPMAAVSRRLLQRSCGGCDLGTGAGGSASGHSLGSGAGNRAGGPGRPSH